MQFKTSAPSNIALVKYWGKYDNQLPSNPSISFTLNVCKTEMDIQLKPIESSNDLINVFFEGKLQPSFATKIENLFRKISIDYPVVNNYKWEIHSQNTFPHSSGIASSASSMCALAKAIVFFQNNHQDAQEISKIARIGSGSACRSIYDYLAWWGKSHFVPGSHQEFAMDCSESIDSMFHEYCDTILIASSDTKSVSSSIGHDLMNRHFYKEKRYEQANTNAIEILGAMRSGDLDKFGEIVEAEALTLHALMMMSNPSFILLKPNTLQMIERIRAFRQETDLPVYFTLDAGPNIHLLYPKSIENKVMPWLNDQLKPLCENEFLIQDYIKYEAI
jgi:diphosphomevalonate decarboxylase